MTSDADIYLIPPHGMVKLEDFSGGDLTVVNAARVSFGARSQEIGDREEKLIRFLMRERHASPFEHSTFQFYVKCPIFVAREWFRHRWSSFNEFSMRYAIPGELQFWLPIEEDWRTQVGKPGAYSFEPLDDELLIKHNRFIMQMVYSRAEKAYNELIEKGVAKEIARAVLPVGTYTEFYWTVNARSLINFISLRNDSAAQREIQHFAIAIEKIFAQKMPITYNSFIDFERKAI